MLALCFCYEKATQVKFSCSLFSCPGDMCQMDTTTIHDAVDSVCTVFDNAFKLLSNYLGHLSPKASSSHISLDIWANMKISSPKARATLLSADKSMSIPKLILLDSKYYIML